MMRGLALTFCLAGLAACAPMPDDTAPNVGTGVGFGNYQEYMRQQESQRGAGQQIGATQQQLPPAGSVSTAPLPSSGSVSSGGTDAASLARETRAALNVGAAVSADAPLQASPVNPAPEAVNALGISRENDFAAVGEQRTIEEDQAFIEANRARYEQVQPQALPPRTDTGPNIVAYALQTRHPVGQPVYRRIGLNLASRSQRNCASYASPDLAQAAFLAEGGPDRDRMALDPDGDGYACAWDPTPFRKAAGG